MINGSRFGACSKNGMYTYKVEGGEGILLESDEHWRRSVVIKNFIDLANKAGIDLDGSTCYEIATEKKTGKCEKSANLAFHARKTFPFPNIDFSINHGGYGVHVNFT